MTIQKYDEKNRCQVGKIIRNELKNLFPECKFTVRYRSFAGGDAIDITWKDGYTEDQVNQIAGKYEYATYNAQFDYWESGNRREDIPQVKYVQYRREYSPDRVRDCEQAFPDQDWYQILKQTDLTEGFCPDAIKLKTLHYEPARIATDKVKVVRVKFYCIQGAENFVKVIPRLRSEGDPEVTTTITKDKYTFPVVEVWIAPKVQK